MIFFFRKLYIGTLSVWLICTYNVSVHVFHIIVNITAGAVECVNPPHTIYVLLERRRVGRGCAVVVEVVVRVFQQTTGNNIRILYKWMYIYIHVYTMYIRGPRPSVGPLINLQLLTHCRFITPAQCIRYRALNGYATAAHTAPSLAPRGSSVIWFRRPESRERDVNSG